MIGPTLPFIIWASAKRTRMRSVGPNDYSRARELEEIEKSFDNPDAFKGMERQRATEAWAAQNYPATSKDGRGPKLMAASLGPFVSQSKTAIIVRNWQPNTKPSGQPIGISTTCRSFYPSMTNLKHSALQSSHIRNIELLTNLLQLLFNSVLLDQAPRDDCHLDERAEKVRKALREMAGTRADRPNNSLEARSSLLLLRLNFSMVNHDRSELPEIWEGFRRHPQPGGRLGRVSGRPTGAADRNGGNVAGNDPGYNALVEQLAEFIGKRESEELFSSA